jgi:hypothetical protein
MQNTNKKINFLIIWPRMMYMEKYWTRLWWATITEKEKHEIKKMKEENNEVVTWNEDRSKNPFLLQRIGREMERA